MCSEIDDTMVRGNRDIDESISLDSGIDTDALEAELADLLDSDEASGLEPTKGMSMSY